MSLRRIFLAPTTPIWVDFWIFSDQAQLLNPESAASKDVGAQIRSCCVNWGRWRLWARFNAN